MGDPFRAALAARKGGSLTSQTDRVERSRRRVREGVLPERSPRNTLWFKDMREVSSREDNQTR